MTSVPTSGETFAKMIYHIQEAQSCAAMLSHLERANNSPTLARQWLQVQESLKYTIRALTAIATRKMQ